MEQDREKENVAPGIEEGRPAEKIRPLSEDERLMEQIRQAEQEDAARKKRRLTAILGLIACVAVFGARAVGRLGHARVGGAIGSPDRSVKAVRLLLAGCDEP